MEVNRSSWHARVYSWWYSHKYNHGYPVMKASSNLCPYMRAVMFWAPLRFIFWNWVEIKVTRRIRFTLNCLTLPLMAYFVPLLLGYVSYYLKIALWGAFLGMSVLTILTVCVLGTVFFIKESIMDYRHSHPEEPKPPKPPKKKSEFWKLLGEYLRSGHDRICPEIEFTSDEYEEHS